VERETQQKHQVVSSITTTTAAAKASSESCFFTLTPTAPFTRRARRPNGRACLMV
jgi:hypothetical protein